MIVKVRDVFYCYPAFFWRMDRGLTQQNNLVDGKIVIVRFEIIDVDVRKRTATLSCRDRLLVKTVKLSYLDRSKNNTLLKANFLPKGITACKAKMKKYKKKFVLLDLDMFKRTEPAAYRKATSSLHLLNEMCAINGVEVTMNPRTPINKLCSGGGGPARRKTAALKDGATLGYQSQATVYERMRSPLSLKSLFYDNGRQLVSLAAQLSRVVFNSMSSRRKQPFAQWSISVDLQWALRCLIVGLRKTKMTQASPPDKEVLKCIAGFHAFSIPELTGVVDADNLLTRSSDPFLKLTYHHASELGTLRKFVKRANYLRPDGKKWPPQQLKAMVSDPLAFFCLNPRDAKLSKADLVRKAAFEMSVHVGDEQPEEALQKLEEKLNAQTKEEIAGDLEHHRRNTTSYFGVNRIYSVIFEPRYSSLSIEVLKRTSKLAREVVLCARWNVSRRTLEFTEGVELCPVTKNGDYGEFAEIRALRNKLVLKRLARKAKQQLRSMTKK